MSTFPRQQLKRVATVTVGKMLQPNSAGGSDVELEYLRAAHIQPLGRLAELDSQKMWFSAAEQRQLSLQAGDVVVVEGGAGYGRSALLTENRTGWAFQNSVIRVRPMASRADGAFLNYAIQDSLASGEVDFAINTATIPHFTTEKVARHEVPLPNVTTQRWIAEYLDRETAEIDAFIADQEELIALLTERRATTLLDGVTGHSRALDWAASVPDTWSVTSLRNAFTVLDCKHITAPESEGGFPLVSVREVQGKVVDLGQARMTDRKHFDLLTEGGRALRSDDLVVCRNASVGKVARVPQGAPAMAMGQDVSLIRASGLASTRFLQHVLLSPIGVQAFDVASVGSTFKRINVEDIKAIPVPLPPVGVQHEIAAYLDHEISEIDASMADAREAIALSKERRAALISVAVTGKLTLGT